MGRSQRFQPTRSARSAGLTSDALPSTTLPQVLEHSTLRLSDIMRSSEYIAGEGILQFRLNICNQSATQNEHCGS